MALKKTELYSTLWKSCDKLRGGDGCQPVQGLRPDPALREVRVTPLDHEDKEDARACALVAHLFATQLDALEVPSPNVPEREGWIWVPRGTYDILETTPLKDSR